MRAVGSCALLEIFSNSQLLPSPHPALRATFPPGEGVGAGGAKPRFYKLQLLFKRLLTGAYFLFDMLNYFVD